MKLDKHRKNPEQHYSISFSANWTNNGFKYCLYYTYARLKGRDIIGVLFMSNRV